MKRLFWSLFCGIVGALAVWFFTRRHMDALYGDVSRLREVERKYDSLVEKERLRAEAFREGIEEMERDREFLPEPSPEQKIRMAMMDAIYTSHAREALGEHFIEDEDEDGEDES